MKRRLLLKQRRNRYSSTIAPSGFDWDLGTLGVLVFYVGCAFALINKEKEYGTLTYCMG